jgi:endonuclease/exonuclease/phosphatase family metal-dependent hydrolase
MRIATYNFLHGGSARRSGHLQQVLAATNADIVLCQEAKTPDASEAPILTARDTWFWQPVPGYRWGSGILVRGKRAKEIRVLGFEGWVTGAEIKLARTLRILSVHCPAGEGGYVRTMHRLLDVIAPLRKRADLVIGGDFNVATGYRGAEEAVKMTRGERDLLDRLTGEFNLLPCWQTAHAGEPLAQTLRWSADRIAPYHCDGVFMPRAWQPLLRSCEVLSGPPWDELSDHNPVVTEVDVALHGHTLRAPKSTLEIKRRASQT